MKKDSIDFDASNLLDNNNNDNDVNITNNDNKSGQDDDKDVKVINNQLQKCSLDNNNKDHLDVNNMVTETSESIISTSLTQPEVCITRSYDIDVDEERKLDSEWLSIVTSYEALKREHKKLNEEMNSLGLEVKLFVGNLSASTTELELAAMFEKYDTVKEATILRDRNGESKRSGFVKFVSHYDAQNAINDLNGKVQDKNEQAYLAVRFAQPKKQNKKSRNQMHSDNGGNLYVNNLNSMISDAHLTQLFAPFGELANVKSISHLGHGFVHFVNYDDAQKAITYLNNKMGPFCNGRPLQVSFKRKSNKN